MACLNDSDLLVDSIIASSMTSAVPSAVSMSNAISNSGPVQNSSSADCQTVPNTSGVHSARRKRVMKANDANHDDGFKNPKKVARASSSKAPAPPTTSNRYSDLSDDSDCSDMEAFYEDPANASTSQAVKKTRIPPIVLRDIDNWASLSKEIGNNCSNKFRAKLSGETIRISLESIDDYRKITKLFGNSDIQFYTYRLQTDKNIRAVIRGLHHKILPSEVFEDLTAQGIPVAKAEDVKQMGNVKTGKKFPLFLVQVPRTEAGKKIWGVTSVLNMIVKMENVKKKTGPTQCYRCQRWSHGQASCFNSPRCLKCAGDHLTHNCQKTKDDGKPATCCNCGANHPANWRGCAACPKPKTSRVQSNRTFAAAATEALATDSTKDFPALPQKQSKNPVTGSALSTIQTPNVDSNTSKKMNIDLVPQPPHDSCSDQSAIGDVSTEGGINDIFSIINMLSDANAMQAIALFKKYLDKFLKSKTWQDKVQILSEGYTAISAIFSTGHV